MKDKAICFENADVADTIVRKRPEVFEPEYISKNNLVWKKTVG